MGGENLEFHHRDIILCVRSLFGNPEFTQDLIVAPERHYTNAERSCRIYDELHTGDWWWSVQVRACAGAFIKYVLICVLGFS